MIVALSEYELLTAAIEGARRNSYGLVRNLDTQGRPGQGWNTHIEGAAAEMAACKALSLYWTVQSFATRHAGDIGGGREVRFTHRPEGRLILHPRDPDEAVFYLVRGASPIFDVVGSIVGRAGKQAEYWQQGDGRAAFFVPASALAPLEAEVWDA